MEKSSKTRIALGMSGGVDSAVSAALLLQAGYEVIGVTCRFLDSPSSDAAEADARAVCQALGIPHAMVSAQKLFQEKIIEPFAASYESGTTPCPCIECNERCKMPALCACADQYGCDKVATGHYARVVEYALPTPERPSVPLDNAGKSEARRNASSRRFVVKNGLDAKKDQSYMLGLLSQEQLSRLVLPLGGLTKAEVRIIAADLNLPVARKTDSQDSCFIEGDYRDYLRERGITGKPGDVVRQDGCVVGKHAGLPFYTIGQRKGLGIAAPEPYYVLEKRLEENRLVVGFAAEAKIDGATVKGVRWQAAPDFETALNAFGVEGKLHVRVKLRYRSAPQAATLERVSSEAVRVRLDETSAPTAPGQYMVAYLGSMVLCAGVIDQVHLADPRQESALQTPARTPRLRKIFVVGGMGAGKSTAAHALASCSLPVIDMDELGHEAHALPEVATALAKRFGRDILAANGQVNRALLAKRAFANAQETKALNDIMFCPIMRLLEEKLFELAGQRSDAGREGGACQGSDAGREGGACQGSDAGREGGACQGDEASCVPDGNPGDMPGGSSSGVSVGNSGGVPDANSSGSLSPHAAVVIEFSTFKERIPELMDENDLVLAVLAPENTRIARAVAKGWSESDVRARLARQISDEQRARLADVSFVNDATPEDLAENVIKWWHEFNGNI